MSFRSTRFGMTATPSRVIGSASTVIVTAGASPSNPVHICILSLQAGRLWLGKTSAHTTANSFHIPGFSNMHFDATHGSDELFGFTSGATTMSVSFTAGLQS